MWRPSVSAAVPTIASAEHREHQHRAEQARAEPGPARAGTFHTCAIACCATCATPSDPQIEREQADDEREPVAAERADVAAQLLTDDGEVGERGVEEVASEAGIVVRDVARAR